MSNTNLPVGIPDGISPEAIASDEYDMLEGNINRMFMTDSHDEFERMYSFAKRNRRRI